MKRPINGNDLQKAFRLGLLFGYGLGFVGGIMIGLLIGVVL